MCVCVCVCVGGGGGGYMIFPTINIVFLVNHRIPRAAIKLVVHDLLFQHSLLRYVQEMFGVIAHLLKDKMVWA